MIRDALHCWHLADGESCDAELQVVDHTWTCPRGHKLRTAPSALVDATINLAQGSPGLTDRFFEPRGDRG
jgi:hypothetical protein